MKRAAHFDIPRRVDDAGRVWFSGESAAELLLRGFELKALCVEPDATVAAHNRWCDALYKPEYVVATASPEAPRSASHEWLIGEPYESMPVLETLLAKCQTDEQRQRVYSEVAAFESKNLLPLLRVMFKLVDHCRSNNVLIGVGRGSSVCSYVLYLIGVHKINPMNYGLEITDFLKD